MKTIQLIHPTLLSEIKPGEKFQVLMSSKEECHPTIYTLTHFKKKGDTIFAECTFQISQNGNVYTQSTIFPDTTLIKMVKEVKQKTKK